MGLLILVMYGFLVVNYLGWFLIRRVIVVQVRRARECEFEMCSDCLYSLHGLPPEGKCPECGREIALSCGVLADAGGEGAASQVMAVFSGLVAICALPFATFAGYDRGIVFLQGLQHGEFPTACGF